jgi:hypothetical protein
MKKSIVFTLSFAAALLFAGLNKSDAQTPVTVLQGSTHTYSVTPVPDGATYEYHWSVSGGTSSIPGNTSTTGNIVWDGATGQYTLSVYVENPATGCAGNNKVLVINVVALGITLVGPANPVCPHTDNQTGDFIVTVNYTGTDAWSFVINDGVTDRTISVPAGTQNYDVTIPGYTNTSALVTAGHTIRITSVTTTSGTVTYDGNEVDAANHGITVTVQPTPATSDIIQN